MTAPDNPAPPVDERRRSADRRIFNKVAFTDEGVPLRLLGFHVAGTPRPADQHQIGVELNRVPTDAEKAAIWKAVDAALAAAPPVDVEGVTTFEAIADRITREYLDRREQLRDETRNTDMWAIAEDELRHDIKAALTAARSQGWDEAREAQSSAARDVLAERRRQVEAEGWTPEHDDDHRRSEMALAAACYAISGSGIADRTDSENWWNVITRQMWPPSWAWHWWKPGSRRRDLVKAGALILAEIERLDRAAIRTRSEAPNDSE